MLPDGLDWLSFLADSSKSHHQRDKKNAYQILEKTFCGIPPVIYASSQTIFCVNISKNCKNKFLTAFSLKGTVFLIGYISIFSCERGHIL